MKRIIITILLIAGAAVIAQAQDAGRFLKNDKIAKEIGLTDEETAKINELWISSEKKIDMAEADRDIKAAELKKLLLQEPVKMNEIEKVLRQAMEAEYTIRLTNIQRMLQIKDIISSEKWIKLQKYLREYRGRMREDGRSPHDRQYRDFPDKRPAK